LHRFPPGSRHHARIERLVEDAAWPPPKQPCTSVASSPMPASVIRNTALVLRELAAPVQPAVTASNTCRVTNGKEGTGKPSAARERLSAPDGRRSGGCGRRLLVEMFETFEDPPHFHPMPALGAFEDGVAVEPVDRLGDYLAAVKTTDADTHVPIHRDHGTPRGRQEKTTRIHPTQQSGPRNGVRAGVQVSLRQARDVSSTDDRRPR